MSNSCIRTTAIIAEVHRAGMFTGYLEDNPDHAVTLTASGKMKVASITIVVGDLVDIEMSAYDLSRGRIIWRHHDPHPRG